MYACAYMYIYIYIYNMRERERALRMSCERCAGNEEVDAEAFNKRRQKRKDNASEQSKRVNETNAKRVLTAGNE